MRWIGRVQSMCMPAPWQTLEGILDSGPTGMPLRWSSSSRQDMLTKCNFVCEILAANNAIDAIAVESSWQLLLARQRLECTSAGLCLWSVNCQY